MTAPTPHTHIRICGSYSIARALPDFFTTHDPAPEGYEWQPCLHCDFGHDKPVKLPTDTERVKQSRRAYGRPTQPKAAPGVWRERGRK